MQYTMEVSGTSFAAPIITGNLAYLARKTEIPVKKTYQELLQTAVPFASDAYYHRGLMGKGFIAPTGYRDDLVILRDFDSEILDIQKNYQYSLEKSFEEERELKISLLTEILFGQERKAQQTLRTLKKGALSRSLMAFKFWNTFDNKACGNVFTPSHLFEGDRKEQRTGFIKEIEMIRTALRILGTMQEYDVSQKEMTEMVAEINQENRNPNIGDLITVLKNNQLDGVFAVGVIYRGSRIRPVPKFAFEILYYIHLTEFKTFINCTQNFYQMTNTLLYDRQTIETLIFNICQSFIQ